MAGGKRCYTVLMVLLLVGATSCELGWCWGDAMANAKEHLNIAANWAQEQFSGAGVNKETADGIKDKAADSASGAAGAMNSAASDASKYATEKADQVGGMVNGGDESRRSSLEGGEEETEVNSKFDELKNSYDDTMKKVEESYHSAKDTISDKTKQTYESAKEMASDAAANVGVKMSQTNNAAEL